MSRPAREPVSALVVVLRSARPSDCRMVFQWTNDPQTRAASFHSDPIGFSEHEGWYLESLQGQERRLMIAEDETGAPMGMARFDYQDRETAEIGISVAPDRRGRGLSYPLVRAALKAALSQGLNTVIARIRPDNQRSIRVFEAVGFVRVGEEEVAGAAALRFELRLEALHG